MKGIKGLDRGPVVTVGLALAMLGCFVVGVYLPNVRRLEEARSELREAKSQLADAVSLAEQLPAVASRVEAMESEYERCLARVPREPMVPQFLEAVADLLQAEGIVQRELVPQRARPRESYTELPISITLEGPFSAVYRVLARLERLERTNHLESIKFTTLPRSEGQLRVEMAVTIYYQHGAAEGSQAATAGRASNT